MVNTTQISVGNHVVNVNEKYEGAVVEINRTRHTARIKVETEEYVDYVVAPLAELQVVSQVVEPYARRKKKTNLSDKNEWWNWVREFQLAFNHPAPDKPTMLTKERIEKRNSWMLEECEEMAVAETLEDQVDAAIDKLYFALGDLVELGVEPHNLLEIVQKANMGKLHEVDGKMVPVYKEDGKVKKPDNWEKDFAPEAKLKKEIKRQSKKKN